VLVGRDRFHGLPGDYRVVRCRTCGLMRTDPRPTPATMGYYYPDDYGPYVGTVVPSADPAAPALPRWKVLLGSLFQFNHGLIPPVRPGRMLEIGCASGAFLHKMAGLGWEVEGIEFSSTAAAAARALGYRVTAGAVEEAPPPQSPYDLIIGWMVLEHLHQPVEVLRKLRRWVRPGGWLVISVPDADSIDFRLFTGSWFAAHLPNHLYHYTKETIRKVLGAGGWRVRCIHHQRNVSNLIGSLGNYLQDRGILTGAAKRLASFPADPGRGAYYLYPLSYLLSVAGQTGRMEVWARAAHD
jgi:SAM-dependent methyltransferase